MSYLIDSDVIIYHLNGVPAATQLLRRLFMEDPAISAITYVEVLEGIQRGSDSEIARARLDALTARVPLLDFSRAEAERCAQLRSTLWGQGRRVRSRALDLLIAATASEHGLTLVTNNPDDYADIPELDVNAAQISPS